MIFRNREDLVGKTILVTGASMGLGRSAAIQLASRGAHLILVARSEDKLKQVQTEIETAGGHALVFAADLSKTDSISAIYDTIYKTAGTPDIIVHSAGAGSWREIEATSPQENMEMLSLPYLAAFNITRCFMPAMLKRNSGHIIRITSPASFFSFPGAVSYSVARWAVRGFFEALSADLNRTNIQTTLYCPGEIQSTYFENNPGSHERISAINKILPVLSVNDAAQGVVYCATRRPKVYFKPAILGWLNYANQLLPGVVNQISIATGWRRAQ